MAQRVRALGAMRGVQSVERSARHVPIGTRGGSSQGHAGMLQQQQRDADAQYVAMCLIVRDQHEDLAEWIEHYLRLGVGRIYLYDNGSDPPLMTVVGQYVLHGVVGYRWVPTEIIEAHVRSHHRNKAAASGGAGAGVVNAQMWVYKRCLSRYREHHRWMAFFDADEFLLLKNPAVSGLPALLKGYEAFGGLVVNWMVFGTSGHKARPNGTTLGSYTKCSTSKMVKTIANTRYTTGPSTPHSFLYSGGAYAVDELKRKVDGVRVEGWTGQNVVLNHYITKSVAEFTAKSLRGSGDGGRKSVAFMETVDRGARNVCTDAVSLMQGRVWKVPSAAK